MDKDNFRLLKPLARGFILVILAMFLSVWVAKKYLNYVTPMYESTVKLKLADVKDGEPSTNLFKDFDVFASANKIQTEIEVLKSSSLIEKTVENIPFSTEIYRKGDVLNAELYKNSPFFVEGSFSDDKNYDIRFQLNILSNEDFELIAPHFHQTIKGNFENPVKIPGGTLLLSLNKPFIQSKLDVTIIDQYEFEFLSREKLYHKISKDLDIVSVDKDVPVIRINYKSSVPEKAALLVNKLAETYIKDYIKNKVSAANTAVNFLKDEITIANEKLSETEDKIQTYRDRNNIINITQETETDLRKIAQLKIQRTNVKMNLDAVKDLNNYIAKSNGDISRLSTNFEAFNDLLSTEIMKKIELLRSEKKELLLTYTSEHEKVKVIDSKIKDLYDYQIESVKNTERNLQIKFDDINQDIALAEQVFIGLPEKEKLLTIMNREFNLYENSYNFLNEKRIEAEIAKSAEISFHKIITKGEIPKKPVSPVRSIILIVAAIVGMLGSIALIYLVHFAKAKVNDSYTIEKNSSIPIAYATPFIKNNHEIASHFLQNAMELEMKSILKPNSIISVTSYNNIKDHNFQIKNLFEVLQSQGRKVVLLDVVGNFDKNLNNNIVNFSKPEIFQKTKSEINLLLKEKTADFEFCLINNLPIKNSSFATLFMSLADENLVVLDSRKTSVKSLQEVELLKEEFSIANLWFVLNKSDYNPSVITEIKYFLSKRRK